MDYTTNRLKPLLIDYVQEITRKSKGRNQYICPFCNSGTGRNGTGAFTLYPETNTYTCFACGENGDIFTLYAKMNSLDFRSDFPLIIEELERKYNLPSSKKSTSPERGLEALAMPVDTFQGPNYLTKSRTSKKGITGALRNVWI